MTVIYQRVGGFDITLFPHTALYEQGPRPEADEGKTNAQAGGVREPTLSSSRLVFSGGNTMTDKPTCSICNGLMLNSKFKWNGRTTHKHCVIKMLEQLE